MMAEYKMKGGVTLTDADFERMATEAEAGVYPGTPGEWIVCPQGRPRIAEEELVVVTCKVPRSQRDAMDRKAEQRGETRSEWMRNTFAAALGM
jgi:hypothetical protein